MCAQPLAKEMVQEMNHWDSYNLKDQISATRISCLFTATDKKGNECVIKIGPQDADHRSKRFQREIQTQIKYANANIEAYP